MAKVLITGIAGFLGSNFAEFLKNRGEDVIGVDNLFGGYISNVPKGVDTFIGDVENLSFIDNIFKKENPDFVYHFAAYAAEGLSPFMRNFNYKNNLLATANIVNCCINYNVKRLIFSSSMSVYGRGAGNKLFDEKDVPCPIDPYAVAKYACEMDIKIAGEQHNLDWCIIRPHNIYGPKQNIWDRYRNVLGIWMYQYMNNQDMTIFGDGSQIRAFSYIDDYLEPLYKCSYSDKVSKEIINLGGIKEYSILEASTILRKVLGGGTIKHLEPRHEVHHAVPTWQKSIDLLDFEHTIDLEEGLSVMWDWAKRQPKRDRVSWDNYEVESKLYEFWKN